MARCSKCGIRLRVSALIPGVPRGASLLMGGEELTALTEHLQNQPRACQSCYRNYCSSCASRASTANRFACPKCGKDLGDLLDRPTFIQGAPCDFSKLEAPFHLHVLQRKLLTGFLLLICFGGAIGWFYRREGDIPSFIGRATVSIILGGLIGFLLMIPITLAVEVYLRARGR